MLNETIQQLPTLAHEQSASDKTGLIDPADAARDSVRAQAAALNGPPLPEEPTIGEEASEGLAYAALVGGISRIATLVERYNQEVRLEVAAINKHEAALKAYVSEWQRETNPTAPPPPEPIPGVGKAPAPTASLRKNVYGDLEAAAPSLKTISGDWGWEDGDFVVAASGDIVTVEGARIVAQDLVARLISPRGSHWAHPDDGMDSQRFVNATADELTVLELRQEIELEVLNDVRVRRSSAEVTTPDLVTGVVRVRAELGDRTLALALPPPTSLLREERQYGTFFVVERRGAVIKLVANRVGQLDETEQEATFEGINPAQFGDRTTMTLTIAGVQYPVEVLEANA